MNCCLGQVVVLYTADRFVRMGASCHKVLLFYAHYNLLDCSARVRWCHQDGLLVSRWHAAGFAAADKLSATEASRAAHAPATESTPWRGQDCDVQMLVCLWCDAVQQHHAGWVCSATSVAECRSV